ncbi:MAG: acyltransferase [Verrucomicrobiales bacterium]|nr:acyltransferase [Verrucomicrobiales bacterium]
MRLFLALVVVAAHTLSAGRLPLIGGNLAVRLFFVVSGFYMALILSAKYNQPGGLGRRLFYSNRALRIFPLLGLVLALEVVLAFLVPALTGGPWAEWPRLLGRLWDQGRFTAIAAMAGAQISGFGVDLVHLFSFDGSGGAHWYSGPVTGDGFRGWQPLPMSHAWSISCELVFYLLAPLLARLRLPALVGVAVASALLDPIMAKGAGLVALSDVASSFAAPLQFGYFILGILAYRLYLHPRWSPALLPGLVQAGIVAGFFGLCVFYSVWNRFSYTGTLVLLYTGVTLSIPVLFARCARLSWDREIGDLSYPVYLVHVTVIRLFDLPSIGGRFGEGFRGSFPHTAAVAAVSIALSWVIVHTIDQRIDAYRQSRLQRAAA